MSSGEGAIVQRQEKERIRCNKAVKRFGALLSTGLTGGIVRNEARKGDRRRDSIEIPWEGLSRSAELSAQK